MDLYKLAVSCVFLLGTLVNNIVGDISEIGPEHGYIHLDNNGYKGILIAVDSTVPYDPVLLGNIQNYMDQTSKALHKSTILESPLYFKEITVLIPQSWPKLSQCGSVTSEIQNGANFLIAPDTPQWGSNPHTIRVSSQCGEPGVVTILPESFVKDENVAKRYGVNVGKTILHEWAHLRYGVFDESNEESGGNSCIWFEGGGMYPVKCSTDIKGKVRALQNGKGCEFIPDDNQPSTVTASLMYKHYLSSIDQFCDKDGDGLRHNDQVPNPQNDRCDGKSVWEVLRNHQDFKNVRRGRFKRQDITPEAPTLRCVQSRQVARMVLTMDVSSSMKTRSRLSHMQQDVELFLKNIPCRETAVGLVEFSATNTERVLHNLVPVSSENNLKSLIDSIPQRVINRTCIGCGIKTALRAIRQSGMSTQGAVIVVFTDGLENDRPKIKDITQEVLRSGVVVYGILLLSTAEDHELIKLAQKTGGKSCVYTDRQNQASYYNCLEGILHHRSPHAAPIQVIHTMIEIQPSQHTIGTVYIDSALSKNTLVSVTWSSGCNKLYVTMMSPKDEIIDDSSVTRYVRDTRSRSITIDVSGYTAGKWTYILNNKHTYSSCSVRLLVEGRQKLINCTKTATGDDPVMMVPIVSGQRLQLDPAKTGEQNAIKLYARLAQGPSPIINANVHAAIESSSGKKWNLSLWDNGAGVDFMALDGIYSRYFIGFNEHENQYRRDDTYSIKFDVQWQSITRVRMSMFSFGSGAPARKDVRGKPSTSFLEVEPFQRSSSGSYFSIYHSVEQNPVIYVPAKIADLRVTIVDRMQMKVKLSWTSLGDELDQGKALKYKIGVSTSARNLRNSFDSGHIISEANIISGSLMHPKIAGERETIVLQLSDHSDITNDTLYYIAVKTMNTNGLYGPVSNVQMFIFMFGNYYSEPVIGDEPGIANWIFYIVGIAVAIIVLSLIIVFIVLLRRRRKQSDDDDIKDTESNIYDDVVVAKSVQERAPPNLYTEGVSNRDTSSGQNAPDLLNEIQSAKANLKKQQRFKKKDDGVYTIASRISSKENNKSSVKKRKVERKSILRSLRKTGSGMFKRQKPTENKPTRKPIHKPWMSPDEPLQDHSYTNPLFGESAIIPEMVVRNSVIVEK